MAGRIQRRRLGDFGHSRFRPVGRRRPGAGSPGRGSDPSREVSCTAAPGIEGLSVPSPRVEFGSGGPGRGRAAHLRGPAGGRSRARGAALRLGPRRLPLPGDRGIGGAGIPDPDEKLSPERTSIAQGGTALAGLPRKPAPETTTALVTEIPQAVPTCAGDSGRWYAGPRLLRNCLASAASA